MHKRLRQTKQPQNGAMANVVFGSIAVAIVLAAYAYSCAIIKRSEKTGAVKPNKAQEPYSQPINGKDLGDVIAEEAEKHVMFLKRLEKLCYEKALVYRALYVGKEPITMGLVMEDGSEIQLWRPQGDIGNLRAARLVNWSNESQGVDVELVRADGSRAKINANVVEVSQRWEE